MEKQDLVTGIILIENGEMTDDDLISFVREHKDTLLQLQGSWQRMVYQLEEANLI